MVVSSQSATFKVADIPTGSASPSYVLVKGINSFTGFDGNASEIDITTLDSTAKEFMMGLQDYGNFTLNGFYLKTDPGQVKLRAAKADTVARLCQVTLPDKTVFAFKIYVMSADASGGVDEAVATTFTLRITGDVTVT